MDHGVAVRGRECTEASRPAPESRGALQKLRSGGFGDICNRALARVGQSWPLQRRQGLGLEVLAESRTEPASRPGALPSPALIREAS